MNVTALRLVPKWRRYGLAQLRGLLSGFWYVMVTNLALWSSSIAEDLIDKWPQVPAVELLQQGINELFDVLQASAPGVLVLTVVVNLSPRSGLRSWLLLAITAAILTLSFRLYLQFHSGDPATAKSLLAGYIMACYGASIYMYYGTVRGAQSALLRAQIRSATLAAELNRAQLTMLRAQIEPHFIFNTLATVRMLGRIDREEAVQLMDNLRRYFSAALPRMRRDEAQLSDELDLVDAYLRIHQVRMGARLAYEIEAPHDLLATRVPTMMLMTLVENAIKHGLNPALNGGFIRVTARREKSMLELRVADSGEGMQSLLGSGTGLANIRTRLTLLYGQRALFSIARAEPRGVVATIRLPLGAVA